MSQNGRGLNGGVNEIYFTLQFVYQLFNSARSFLVDASGNVNCNNISSTGTVTSNGFIQKTGSGSVNLENQIVVLQGQVATLQSQVAVLQSQVAVLQTQVATLNSEVSTLTSEVNSLLALFRIQGYILVTWNPITSSYTTAASQNLSFYAGRNASPSQPGVIGINFTGTPDVASGQPIYTLMVSMQQNTGTTSFVPCSTQFSTHPFVITGGGTFDVGFEMFNNSGTPIDNSFFAVLF